jgi:hypothetical protein
VSTPPDDPTIVDDDDLLRRVPNRPRMVTTESDGKLRPTSAALALREGETGCSVDVRGRLEDPDEPLTVLDGHDAAWGVATCTAGAARTDGAHHVVSDELPDNRAHAQVVPTATSKSAQRRNFKSLAERMTFVQDPVIEPAAD